MTLHHNLRVPPLYLLGGNGAVFLLGFTVYGLQFTVSMGGILQKYCGKFGSTGISTYFCIE